MSNVVHFPEIRPIQSSDGSIFDITSLQAFAARHAQNAPERIIHMSVKLSLAAKAAEILHSLIEEIKAEFQE